MLVIVLIALTLILLYYNLFIKPLNTWKNRGVIQANTRWFFGDSYDLVVQKKSFAGYIKWQYDRFKNERYAGTYLLMTPSLLIRDPDLLKQITIKDFEHFTDHSSFVHEELDPLWGRNLFLLTGQKWKNMRSILSPSFTSSKMRTIFNLMAECTHRFCENLLNKNDETFEIEVKDLFTRFTNDVIALTAFGLRVDSVNKPNNKFYLMGREATDLSGWKNLMLLLYLLYPPIAKFKWFSVKLVNDKVRIYFTDIIKQTLKFRRAKGVIRHDMLQLLMEAQQSNNILKENNSENEESNEFAATEHSTYSKVNRNDTHLTDTDIAAQAMLFFFAGFDTVSTLLSFMSYELALNEDIQNKLRKEIEETYEKCNGELNYDVLVKMKYMDMVVSETLRKWPPFPQMDRKCTKPYTIRPVLPYEVPVHLKIGDSIHLPFFALHRDPELFPDPELFDPERFNEERKKDIKQGSYLPFGIGPRNCIGSRFALLEVKVLFFHLLRFFKIVYVNNTKIPVNISPESFLVVAEGNIHLGFQRLYR